MKAKGLATAAHAPARAVDKLKVKTMKEMMRKSRRILDKNDMTFAIEIADRSSTAQGDCSVDRISQPRCRLQMKKMRYKRIFMKTPFSNHSRTHMLCGDECRESLHTEMSSDELTAPGKRR